MYPFNAGEVFKIALKIEENGHAFYEAAARKDFPPEIIELFKGLGQEEISHRGIFQAMLNKLPKETTASTVWDPDNELDKYLKAMADQHVFNIDPKELEVKLEDVKTPIDAVKMAMGFERDTIVFFLEMMSSTDEPASRDKISVLVDEERKHLKRLVGILEKL